MARVIPHSASSLFSSQPGWLRWGGAGEPGRVLVPQPGHERGCSFCRGLIESASSKSKLPASLLPCPLGGGSVLSQDEAVGHGDFMPFPISFTPLWGHTSQAGWGSSVCWPRATTVAQGCNWRSCRGETPVNWHILSMIIGSALFLKKCITSIHTCTFVVP